MNKSFRINFFISNMLQAVYAGLPLATVVVRNYCHKEWQRKIVARRTPQQRPRTRRKISIAEVSFFGGCLVEVCSVVLAEVNEYFIFDLLLSRFFKKNLKILLRNSSVNYYVYKNFYFAYTSAIIFSQKFKFNGKPLNYFSW